jgi:monoamine oxidase
LLLEARDRIGGRTWTAKAWGEEFEMGGTYIHWYKKSPHLYTDVLTESIRSQPHFYAELHRQGLVQNIKSSAGSTATEYVLHRPKGASVQKYDDVANYNARCAAIAEMLFSIDGLTPRELMPYPHDPSRPQPWMKYDSMSVQHRLDQLDISLEDKQLFAAHTNSFGSATARDIAYTDALRWYALGGYSLATMYDAAASYKLGNGGTTNMARNILNEYHEDRVLNKVVTAVQETRGSRVLVRCADESSYSARMVVCTIPLNCLADVRFDPPLAPVKQEAVMQGHINLGEKYHFSIDKVQRNWFANTSDADESEFLFGLKDHDGTSEQTLLKVLTRH